MDISTIIGIVAGLGLIVYGIISGGGELRSFYDFSSILITIGGTVSATVATFPLSTFKALGTHMKIVFGKNPYKPQEYIEVLVEFAQEARRKGILALEDKAMGQKDKFFSKSVMLVVDAVDPVKTKEMLENELDCIDARHAASRAIYDRAAAYAPSFGMIGTLIGLINMLANLDMDAEGGSKQLTSGMATALITTLYGSMIANLVFQPFSNKLKVRHEAEMLCKSIIVEGVIAIQAGDNPKHIEERLNSFLNNKLQNAEEKKSKKS